MKTKILKRLFLGVWGFAVALFVVMSCNANSYNHQFKQIFGVSAPTTIEQREAVRPIVTAKLAEMVKENADFKSLTDVRIGISSNILNLIPASNTLERIAFMKGIDECNEKQVLHDRVFSNQLHVATLLAKHFGCQ